MDDLEVLTLPNFETDTRQVFNEHHREQAVDENVFNRLVGLISTDYFQVAPDYFKGKIVLDAGCGSNANASFAFLCLGAEHVFCLDMGDKWLDCANRMLQPFKSRYTLIKGSVLEMPFEDGSFDFVHSAGVLHHTKDARAGFTELARTTKKQGKTFISIMGNKDGLLYQFFNFLRKKYKDEIAFKKIIDEFNLEKLNQYVGWILEEKRANEGLTDAEDGFFRSLFDNDLILTIKDRIQAPTYYDFDFSEEQLKRWYREEGYQDVTRITRYTKGFKNLRRFLAPMYYHYDHPLARFWFGEGYIQLIGTK